MHAFLLSNTLFKTTEYKIYSSNKLKITELSFLRIKTKTLLLSNLNVKEYQSTSSLLPILILLLGVTSISAIIYLSSISILVSDNLLNITAFLSCIFLTLFLINRPEKQHIYTDCFTDNVLFKLANPLTRNSATEDFIKKLDTAIESAKSADSNLIHLKSNAKLQYEIHQKNVDDLFNSGLIEEVLYNRICTSMYESAFGNIDEYSNENVIYLHK